MEENHNLISYFEIIYLLLLVFDDLCKYTYIYIENKILLVINVQVVIFYVNFYM